MRKKRLMGCFGHFCAKFTPQNSSVFTTWFLYGRGRTAVRPPSTFSKLPLRCMSNGTDSLSSRLPTPSKIGGSIITRKSDKKCQATRVVAYSVAI